MEIILNKRQLCDLELLLNGGFAPLEGFMNEKDYRSCLENMTLTNGSIWTIPIVLGTEKAVKVDDIVTLKDETGVSIASMVIDDVYTPDLIEECKYVLGSDDSNHPYHSIIISNTGKYIEVYMKTSLECCIRRDVKGLYKLALEGKVQNFTGVSDPFEEPLTADLVLDGDDINVGIGENVEKILKLIN